ncbi:MAG: helix-turn-helix transcriptional regulator [Thermoguttaceae bacterium]|jgi:transcriptional regulator with XRE-family HTH domain
MNRVQILELRLNMEEQTPAVVPIHLECAHPLHRLGAARRQEHISRRNVARRLGITVRDVRRQECTTTDLPLSVLHKWAQVLSLPVAELVQEPDDSLSPPLFNRARLVLVMKTAMAILEQTGDPQTKQLAQTMVEQLTEIMPELGGVSAWHAVGKRRSPDELGIAAERSLSDEVFIDVVD